MFETAEKRVNKSGSISYWKDGVLIGKRCTKCGQRKLLEEFNRSKKHKDGRRTECRECQKDYNKQWRGSNPNYSKQWKENNPKYSKQHYQNNKEYYKELSKQWRENNKERYKAYDKQYRQEHSEHKRETGRIYRVKIKEDNLQHISNMIGQINPILKNLPVYGYIYRFKNIKTGHVYIGQTTKPLNIRYGKDILKGWIKERRSYENQKFLEEMIEENFEVEEVFDVGICKYHLDKLESYWINQYDSYNNGYNNNLGNHNTNDGLEEFRQILSTHNLKYKDGKIIKSLPQRMR